LRTSKVIMLLMKKKCIMKPKYFLEVNRMYGIFPKVNFNRGGRL